MLDYIRLRLRRPPGADLKSLYLDHRRRNASLDSDGTVLSAYDKAALTPFGVRYQCSDKAGFTIQCSPAKLLSDGNNIFGEGPPAAHDLTESAKLLLLDMPDIDGKRFIHRYPLHAWLTTRIDITFNRIYPTAKAVNAAFKRLRVTHHNNDMPENSRRSLIWHPTSKWRRPKAYRKGPETRGRNKQAIRREEPRPYSQRDLFVANHLLRLELQLEAQWCAEHLPATPQQLIDEWRHHVMPLIEDEAHIAEHDEVREAVYAKYDNRKAASLMVAWRLITAEGYERSRERTDRVTFYRQVRDLKAAGISDLHTWAGHHKRIDDNMTDIDAGRFVNTMDEAEAYLEEVGAAQVYRPRKTA